MNAAACHVPTPSASGEAASPLARFRSARDFLLSQRSNYEAAMAGFRWPQLTHFNWALEHFDDLARGNHNTALWIEHDDGSSTRASYAELAARSNQVANWLEAIGVQRGERVLLMLGNEQALWELMLACIKIGAVMIPATTQLSRDDMIDRFERGRVRAVVCNATQAPRFEGLQAHAPGPVLHIAVGPGATPAGWHAFADAAQASEIYTPKCSTRAEEPLLLYFTSGTTSKPKLVEHTHVSYPVGHLSTMYWTGLQPGDVHWNISSPGWGKHAWSCFFAPFNAGATIYIFNYSRFDAQAVLNALVRSQASSLCAPPTVWRMLIQQDLKAWPVKLREALSAGEPLNPEVIEQVRAAWGVTIRDGFGQTETTAQVGNPPGQTLKFGSMGRPLPGYRIVLLNAEDQAADEGEISIVLADAQWGRATGLMARYADSPEKTAEVMREGHYRSGDVAQRDAEGYITYVGRADDVFKASDYRISPFELESVLIEHPAVAEAAVVPSPDALKLAVPKAFITLAAGQTADEATARSIFAFCREKLAPYKRIRRLQFAALPKTISGKIRRVELRRAEQGRVMPPVAGEAEFFDGA
jgi:acetyl-CoA synthetase